LVGDGNDFQVIADDPIDDRVWEPVRKCASQTLPGRRACQRTRTYELCRSLDFCNKSRAEPSDLPFIKLRSISKFDQRVRMKFHRCSLK